MSIKNNERKIDRSSYDSPWKDILDYFFQSFMEYCYPEVAEEIDWSKGYEFLDKELSKITWDAKTKNRLVDKLIKVYRKDNQETWVLVHCEVQGQPDPDFAQRMFIYRYRIFDKYKKSVASFAILTDTDTSWRPNLYEESLWGSRTSMQFSIFKLIDYKSRQIELKNSKNPFSAVIEAHLAAIETKGKIPQNRLQLKTAITRGLFERSWNKEKVAQLYKFIDWILVLPEELENQFNEIVHQIEEEKQMKYITSTERIGIEKARKETQIAILEKLLKKKSIAIPESVQKKIDQSSNEELEGWIDSLIAEFNSKDLAHQ